MIRFFVPLLILVCTLGLHGTSESQRRPDTADKSGAARKDSRIVVVVSTKNPVCSLTAAELARIFLRKTTRWPNGEAITVYERPVKYEIRQEFSKKVLDQKPNALREYWMNLTLTRGLKPPKVLRTPRLVRRYLDRVKGGIGYLYEDEIDEAVKVVQVVWKKQS